MPRNKIKADEAADALDEIKTVLFQNILQNVAGGNWRATDS